MKKVLTACILITTLCCSIISKGQISSNYLLERYEKLHHLNLYKPILPNAKVSSTSERLIASSSYNIITSGLSLRDSNTYTWSGGRGSIQGTFPQQDVQAHLYDESKLIYGVSGIPELILRQSQTFNSNGDTTEVLIQFWDKLTSTWKNSRRRTTTYIGKQKDVYTEQIWQSSVGTWVNVVKETNTYTSGALSSILNQNWNTTSSTWENSFMLEIDMIGLTSQTTYKVWDIALGTWKNVNRSIGIMTGPNIDEITFQNWNNTTSSWVNDLRFEYSYSTDGMVEHLIKNWSTSSSSWKNSERILNTYSSGKVSKREMFNWIESSGSWQIWDESNCFYTGSNLDKVETRRWVSATSSLENSYQNLYSYNSFGSLTKELSYEWNSGAWVPIALAFENNYYYESYTGLAEKMQHIKNVSIYPNPATFSEVYVDFFTDKAKKTELVFSNMLGQVLYRTKEEASIGKHRIVIPTDYLVNGVYSIQLYSEGELSQTLKLVK